MKEVLYRILEEKKMEKYMYHDGENYLFNTLNRVYLMEGKECVLDILEKMCCVDKENREDIKELYSFLKTLYSLDISYSIWGD